MFEMCLLAVLMEMKSILAMLAGLTPRHSMSTFSLTRSVSFSSPSTSSMAEALLALSWSIF